MKNVVVFDIDGTISDGKHRVHLLPRGEDMHDDSAWEVFNCACDGDAPIVEYITLLKLLYDQNFTTVLLTGRGETARPQTLQWLKEHDVPFDELIMRPEGDCRRGFEFKKEELEKIGTENIWLSFDDLDRNCQMMRELGIQTCQVTEDHGQYG